MGRHAAKMDDETALFATMGTKSSPSSAPWVTGLVVTIIGVHASPPFVDRL
jgi:hypothetical protein